MGRIRTCRTRIAAVVAGVLALAGVTAVASPAAATTVTSPARTHITLEMNECGLMYLGTVGSCIISLQTWMNWAVGTRTTLGPIDGVYGQQTLVLVEAFQRKYVPGVTPDGRFGDRSRAALKDWFIRGATRAHSTGLPCNTALGWGCDIGAAVPGLGLGVAGNAGKTFICAGAGELPGLYGTFSGVFCDVLLS